jgi:hypothetical protein
MKQINKGQARKQYNNGETIIIIAHKMALNTPWNLEHEITKNANCGDATFDFLVNNYEYYNCNYEAGYYCAYYVNGEAGKC